MANKFQDFARYIETLELRARSSLTDKLQNFADGVGILELNTPDDEQLIQSIGNLSNIIFTEDERQAICDMELPAMKDCRKISEEEWLEYDKKTFVKILLLAIRGEMLRAETLRIQFDTRSLLSRTSIESPFNWMVVMRCVKISEEEWLPIQKEEDRQYREELQRLQREYLEKRTMPLQTS